MKTDINGRILNVGEQKQRKMPGETKDDGCSVMRSKVGNDDVASTFQYKDKAFLAERIRWKQTSEPWNALLFARKKNGNGETRYGRKRRWKLPTKVLGASFAGNEKGCPTQTGANTRLWWRWLAWCYFNEKKSRRRRKVVSPADLRWRETVETFLWEQLSALESVRHVARRLVVRHSMVFDDGCRWHGCDAQKPAGYILSQSGSVCCACTKEKIRASEHLRLWAMQMHPYISIYRPIYCKFRRWDPSCTPVHPGARYGVYNNCMWRGKPEDQTRTSGHSISASSMKKTTLVYSRMWRWLLGFAIGYLFRRQ